MVCWSAWAALGTFTDFVFFLFKLGKDTVVIINDEAIVTTCILERNVASKYVPMLFKSHPAFILPVHHSLELTGITRSRNKICWLRSNQEYTIYFDRRMGGLGIFDYNLYKTTLVKDIIGMEKFITPPTHTPAHTHTHNKKCNMKMSETTNTGQHYLQFYRNTY